VLTDLWVFRLW